MAKSDEEGDCLMQIRRFRTGIDEIFMLFCVT